MKKIIKLSCLIITSLILTFLLVAGSINVFRYASKNKDDFSYLSNKANKVILFIGDGMGVNHIENTELYLDKEMFFMSFEKKGYVNTFSKNTFWPTDSAAAATAMATGKKVYNTHVGSSFGKPYTSISEIAKENGLGVGIVTTDTLTGATPASFSAHAKKRSNADEIVNSQLQNNIDLYLGVGQETYVNYEEKFKAKGYEFVTDYKELKLTDSKVLGSFAKVNNYVADENPTLPILVNYTIDYFETNYPDGYFLMIEGAHIDKSNHSNDIMSMIKYLDEFDNSIKLVYDRLGNNEDVCMIVTADHESGKLELANNKEEITNELYKKTKHTKRDVYYLVHQKGNQEINKMPKEIDNTDIFTLTRTLLNI